MVKPNNIVEASLLNTPGVVRYSREDPIEVKPNIFSPIYINLKNIYNMVSKI